MTCCGQKRALAAKPTVAQTPKVANVVVQITQAAQPAARPPLVPPSDAAAHYEYRGPTPVIIIGAVTGARYFFSEPGERLTVDARDCPGLAMIPHLAEVRHP